MSQQQHQKSGEVKDHTQSKGGEKAAEIRGRNPRQRVKGKRKIGEGWKGLGIKTWWNSISTRGGGGEGNRKVFRKVDELESI